MNFLVKTTTNDASIHTNNANGIHERNQSRFLVFIVLYFK